MTEASDAYAEAQRLIAAAKASGATRLDLNSAEFHALTHLPPEIAGLTTITSLDLNNTQIADLSPIAGLTGLSSLLLSNTQIADLSPIAGLTALDVLVLSNTRIADLSPIAGLTALKLLFLRATQITDLSDIAGLTALTDLSLSDTRITDLSPIAGLTAITTLYLGFTQIADLSPISGMTALTSLYLARTLTSDLSPVARLTNLNMLDLDGTSVFDVTPIAALTKLRAVNLDSSGVIDLRPLEALPGLTKNPYPYSRDSTWADADGKPVTVKNGGLSFWNSAAARSDDRIAEISRIEDPATRARMLFEYLKGWVPPSEVLVSEPAEDDLLPVLLVNGQLEISANTPTEAELQNQVNRILHDRLLAKARTLADAAGNEFPDLANRARAVLGQLDQRFDGVNLFALHLELEDLEDRRKAGAEDDQPYSEKVRLALADVTRLGPGLTVGHPQVELLLERRRKAREEPMPAADAIAHDNLGAAVIADGQANGPNIRLTEAEVQAIVDRSAAQAIQRALHRNYVLKIAVIVAGTAASTSLGIAENVIADHFKAEIWHFLATNWTIINEVALTYGTAFANWFTHATEPITQALSTVATIEPRPIKRKK